MTIFNFFTRKVFLSTFLLFLLGIAAFDTKAQGDDSLHISSASQAVLPPPTPILNPGGEKNPSCRYLNSRNSDPDFQHIDSDAEIKIDPPPPLGDSVSQIAGVISVGIQDNDGKNFDFTSTQKITAVVVKGGNEGSNVYSYSVNGGTMGDKRLRLPDLENNISHLTFCYSLAPTSASAMLSGRVRDVNGRNVSRINVTLIKLSTGETLVTRTNSFGRYTFEDLTTAESYLVTVNSKRYVFTPDSKFVNLLEDLTGNDFTALLRENLFE